MDAPGIIEAALDGGTPKARNPNVPRTPEEIAADGIACIEAGAAIVHNHNGEPVVGGAAGVHYPAPCVVAWKQLLASTRMMRAPHREARRVIAAEGP